jgi:hypothetical protein
MFYMFKEEDTWWLHATLQIKNLYVHVIKSMDDYFPFQKKIVFFSKGLYQVEYP